MPSVVQEALLPFRKQPIPILASLAFFTLHYTFDDHDGMEWRIAFYLCYFLAMSLMVRAGVESRNPDRPPATPHTFRTAVTNTLFPVVVLTMLFTHPPIAAVNLCLPYLRRAWPQGGHFVAEVLLDTFFFLMLVFLAASRDNNLPEAVRRGAAFLRSKWWLLLVGGPVYYIEDNVLFTLGALLEPLNRTFAELAANVLPNLGSAALLYGLMSMIDNQPPRADTRLSAV